MIQQPALGPIPLSTLTYIVSTGQHESLRLNSGEPNIQNFVITSNLRSFIH
jgi:hypothetical protein